MICCLRGRVVGLIDYTTTHNPDSKIHPPWTLTLVGSIATDHLLPRLKLYIGIVVNHSLILYLRIRIKIIIIQWVSRKVWKIIKIVISLDNYFSNKYFLHYYYFCSLCYLWNEISKHCIVGVFFSSAIKAVTRLKDQNNFEYPNVTTTIGLTDLYMYISEPNISTQLAASF